MSSTPKPPPGWAVRNHAFIGFTIVTRDPKTRCSAGMGIAQQEEDWLPFAIDLRVVNSIKVYGFDEEDIELTSLYHNGDFIGCVNAAFEDLCPHWVKARSVYDEPAIDVIGQDPTRAAVKLAP